MVSVTSKAFLWEYTTTFPASLFRFIIFVPFGFYFALSSRHWSLISRNPELQAGGLYNPLIEKAEHAAVSWGSFVFYWNFAVWIPAVVLPPAFSILFGLVDLAAAVLLSITTTYQTPWVPHDIDKCRNGGAHQWQRPLGANESFFDAAARLNATTTTSFRMCKDFVVEWQYGVTLSFFYSLIAVLNLVLCSISFRMALKSYKAKGESYTMYLLKRLFLVFLYLFFTLFGIFYVPFFMFFLLPRSIQCPVRMGIKFVVKVFQRLPNPRKLWRRLTPSRIEKKRYRGKGDGTPTGLADFLGIYDILMSVTPHLHYTDIINLSLTSKSVREAVFPAQGYDDRLGHFKRYTCDPDTRQSCWVCVRQICKNCAQAPYIPRWPVYHHLESCRAYCTSCFYKDTVRSRPRAVRTTCACCPINPRPNIFAKWMNEGYYRSGSYYPSVTFAVCRDCNLKPAVELLEIREARSRAELKDASREEGKVCPGCKKENKGALWWVCKKCNKECGSLCHAPWAEKEKKREDIELKGGVVVGEQMV